jgi:Cu-Zn family superoxide dismutase
MNLRTAAVALAAGLAVAAAGCHSMKAEKPARGFVGLQAMSGSTLKGTATFERMEGNWISFRVEVSGISPGLHAVHIHEHGDCTSPDGKSAGGHWNPTAKKHGKWGQADGEFHLGDLGNIDVGPDGTGNLVVSCDQWTLGDGGAMDVVAKSIIVHAKPDDFTTQPTGNAGDRIGCGVIVLQKDW